MASKQASRLSYLILTGLCLIISTFGYAKSPHEFLQEGQGLYAEERYFKAIDSYRNALKANPAYGDAYKYLAEVYYSLGDYSLCLENALNALRYAHSDVDAKLIVANAYRELGEFARAEKYYEEVKKKFPSYSDLYRNMGELYLKMNRQHRSLQMFQKAIRIDGNSWKNFISLGDYYYAIGRQRDAEENYQKGFNLNSRDRRVFIKLAVFYYNTSKINEAIGLLEKGETAFLNFVSGISLLGDCYLKKKNYEKAIEKYQWIINSDYKKSTRYIGWLYFKLALSYDDRDKDKTLDYYRKAIVSLPQNEYIRYAMEEFVIRNYKINDYVRKEVAEYHVSEAKVYYKSGDMKRYMLNLKRAIYIYPFLKRSRADLVSYYEKRKDYYNAYKEIKALYKLKRTPKLKDTIRSYEWRIKTKKILLIQEEMFKFKGLFLMDSSFFNFSKVFIDLNLYISKYYKKFKFSTMEYRESEGINKVLETVRLEDYNIFVIAKMGINNSVIRFTVYDRVGKALAIKEMNFDMASIDKVIERFQVWMDSILPEIGYLREEVKYKEYIVSFGRDAGLRKGDDLVLFEIDRDIQIISSLKVVDAGIFNAKASILTRIEFSRKKGKSYMLMKNKYLKKKHLTKLKRVIVY